MFKPPLGDEAVGEGGEIRGVAVDGVWRDVYCCAFGDESIRDSLSEHVVITPTKIENALISNDLPSSPTVDIALHAYRYSRV